MAIAPAAYRYSSSLHDDQEQEQEQTQMMLSSALTTNGDLVMAEPEPEEDDDDAGGLEEDLKALRASVAALEADDDVLTPESWDWAVGVEAVARQAAERMTQELEHILSSSSSLAAAAAAEEDAALLRARRADAEALAGAARRLMEADLRRLAADAETGSYSYIPTDREMAAAVARVEDVAVVMEQWMASIADTAEFEGRSGEEAFVAAMRREAARAEQARSTLARYRAAAAAAR